MSLPEPYYWDEFATVYCGDNREILPELEPVDLVLTDPPYGIGEARNRRGGKQYGAAVVPSVDYGKSEWDDRPIADDIISTMLSLSKFMIMFGGNYYALPPTSCWLLWDKDNGANYYADAEMAWTNLPQAVRLKKYRWKGMMQEPGRERNIRKHPTQKPLEVMSWCIAQAGKHCEINTILDPFKCIGIEAEEKYCEIAKGRLAQEYLELGG